MKKNTEALVVASKEIGLEVNANETKYVVKSWDQNTGKNHNINLGNALKWYNKSDIWERP